MNIIWFIFTNGELALVVSVLVEEPVSLTGPVELLGQNAQEGRAGEGSVHQGLQRASNGQIDVVNGLVQS